MINHASRRQGGLSLIELMVAVAIMLILTTIAYPLYSDYTMRARRSEGRVMLLNAASREERFYSDNNEYTATIGAGGLGTSSTSENGYYTLSVGGLGANNQTFTLTATPTTFTDTDCGSLTLSNVGVRGSAGGDVCWRK